MTLNADAYMAKAHRMHVVKTRLLSTELGMSLNKVERLRRIADYTGEPIAADDARWAVEEARKLCTAVAMQWWPENVDGDAGNGL